MTKKNAKDLKIEALEAKVKNLEEKKDSKDRWKKIPSKWQIAIVIASVFALIAIACYFYVEIRNATEISEISESEYQRILTVVDGAKWKIAKDSFSLLRNSVNSKLTGEASTFISDGSIELELNGASYGVWATFSYDSGFIKGFLKRKDARLYFSESALKLARTLVVYIDNEKLVFYETE